MAAELAPRRDRESQPHTAAASSVEVNDNSRDEMMAMDIEVCRSVWDSE